MTAAERAAAYSPSSMIGGDPAPFLAEYASASAAARAAIPPQTLAYGPAASQRLDLALPPGRGKAALHLFVHGGYWQELSRRESFFPAPDARARGMAFAALGYTLAPAAALDEIVGEVTRALRFLRAESPRLGLDPGRIVVSGSSAGAHLAAAATLRLAPPERPAGLILLSGIYDLRPLVGTYINAALGLDEAAAARLSPALADLAGLPPLRIAWGAVETDEFKRQSRDFAARARAAGAAVETREAAGRNHFDLPHDLARDRPLGAWLDDLTARTSDAAP